MMNDTNDSALSRDFDRTMDAAYHEIAGIERDLGDARSQITHLTAELQTARGLLEESGMLINQYFTAPLSKAGRELCKMNLDEMVCRIDSLPSTNPPEDPPAMPEIEAMGKLIDGFPTSITEPNTEVTEC